MRRRVSSPRALKMETNDANDRSRALLGGEQQAVPLRILARTAGNLLTNDKVADELVLSISNFFDTRSPRKLAGFPHDELGPGLDQDLAILDQFGAL